MTSGVDAGGNLHLFNSFCALTEIDWVCSLYKMVSYTDTTGNQDSMPPPGNIDSFL